MIEVILNGKEEVQMRFLFIQNVGQFITYIEEDNAHETKSSSYPILKNSRLAYNHTQLHKHTRETKQVSGNEMPTEHINANKILKKLNSINSTYFRQHN